MIIIYINCHLFPFVDWIMKRKKLYETRNRNTLKSFIGKTVYIAETGKHKRPIVKCFCLISCHAEIKDKATYDSLRKQSCIRKGSCFDWKANTKVKHFYRLDNVKPCVPFPVPDNAVRHGRIYATVND